MATAVLTSCSSRLHLLSSRETRLETKNGACSSANLFSNEAPRLVVGRNGRKGGSGATRNIYWDENFALRAQRQTDLSTPRDDVESLDIQVFRFTLGIPGFDDNDLPRLVGNLFGGLIILNHAASLSSVTPALLRSEVVGLLLAAVSVSLPAINRQLNGGKSNSSVELGEKQVFALGENLSDVQRQELAWSSYTLLQNTESTACLVLYGGKVVCARGFWDVPCPDGADTKRFTLEWLEQKLEPKRFGQLEEPLHLPSRADGQMPDIVSKGIASLLVQPLAPSQTSENEGGSGGFLLVISTIPQAYKKKDRLWIAAIAQKLSEILQR
ncbi:hypothetical protein R1sor_019378 [Riccia sorocarpa]|uniref:Uncharacterized protein n=1 Tax=Riccia sorocarpa TaxID=122646 RepID=A0ABD3IDG1_9MARC